MAFTDGLKGSGSKWKARGLESQSDLTEFPGAGQLMETSIKPYDDAKHSLMRCPLWNWRSINVMALALLLPESILAAGDRTTFTTASAYLSVEVLDDDLVHLELSAVGSSAFSRFIAV